MSEAVKKPLIKIQIENGKNPQLYLVPNEKAKAIRELLADYCEEPSDLIDLNEVFPDLKDPSRRPGIIFRGIRIKKNLTQEEMAKKLKIDQADISKIESGKRGIGKELALRIERAFGEDHRRFLS